MMKAQALFTRKWVNERQPRLGQAQLIDSNFSQALNAPQAVVDVWSPTCPACVQYKPVFEEVAASNPGPLMAMVNGNDAPEVVSKYGIGAIPTTLFLQNGQEVGRLEGAVSKETLLSEMSRVFGGISPSGGPSTGGLILGALALAGLGAGAYFLLGKK